MSYSQSVEEEMIRRIVKDLPGPRAVLDIGAFDGVTYSNSRSLIEKGWSGVLIEPNPWAFAKLTDLYSKHEKVRLINAAVGVETRLINFHEGGVYSTADKSRMDHFRKETDWREYMVPQISIDMLVREVPMMADVISIDIEGGSYDVLKVLPITSWCPHVIVVEHDDRIVEICKWARSIKYEACSVTPENLLLLRNGL